MNIYASLFESFVHVEHSLLGQKLKPFCLLHLFWLYQIKSPFVETSKTVTLADVELATIICSSSSSEEIVRRVSIKGQGPLARLKDWYKHRKNKKADVRAESLKFVAYQNDYIALPQFHKKPQTESNEVIPWFFTAACSLMKETGWPAEQVFIMPLGSVLWFNLAFGYISTGQSNIVSDKEQQAIDLILLLAQPGHSADVLTPAV